MRTRENVQFIAAIALPVLFAFALATPVLHTFCFDLSGQHKHIVCADLEYGVYTKEEIEKFESYVPPPGLGTKTPLPEGHNLGPMSDVLTIVVDFNDPGQPNTTDTIGNTVGDFDVTSFGFSADDFELITGAIMAELQEDYFDELVGTVANQNGSVLDINIIEGDIGTAPEGVSEFYFIQVGSGLEGPFIGALGVARGSAVRNQSGEGPNGSTEIGDVVASVFSDNIQGIGGLNPNSALSSGIVTYTKNAIVGTLAHEIGHTLSLSHINEAGSVQPTVGAAPIMGTGAIDLPNQLRITDREFSLSGFNAQNGGESVFHIPQLVSAVELTDAEPSNPPKDIIAEDNFDNNQLFISRTPTPDLSDNPTPGVFTSSVFDVFGIVDRTVNSNFSDDTLVDPDANGLFPSTVTDQFLAYADLENPSNGSGTATVQYVIDINNADNLEFSIDVAALGNFESNDIALITASIDGGDSQLLIELVSDNLDIQEYFFENGSSIILDDPMSSNGFELNNNYQTLTAPVLGTGSFLTLDFMFSCNGGGESVAFDNMTIRGDLEDTGLLGDVNCDGSVDLLDVQPFIDAITNDFPDFKADINGDGSDDLLDVAGFIALISGS